MTEMMIGAPRWEHRLLDLAHQGLAEFQSPVAPINRADRFLEEAYRLSEAITAEHSRSFHFASRFLPGEQRRAIRALYAFCRITDDIVDQPGANAAGELEAWRSQTLGAGERVDHPVALAWRDARQRFGVPDAYAHQLIDGVGRDLQAERYLDFESLAHYCYGVASTVGLMSMHIVGFHDLEAHRYALKLGVALQLTNILRDVGEDLQAGRLYLPLEELARHGISEQDLVDRSVNAGSASWRRFMQHQIARARRLYQEAWPGIGLLHAEGRFAVMAAAELYGGILREIEANEYDVFTRRAHLGVGQKLARLPSIWLRARFGATRALRRAGL